HEGAAAGARWPGKATSGGSRGIAASPTVNAGGGQPAALAQEGRLMFDNVTGVEETRQSAVKGIRIGLFSGLIFGFAATVGEVLVGYEQPMPLRLGARVLLGEGALTASPGTAILVGIIVHFSVSIYYGLL